MTMYKSADEVRAEYVADMGPELGTEFYELTNELTWLCDKWREYTDLFGTSAERVELLEAAAWRFFGHAQGVLWEDVLLHLTRLTDVAKRGRGARLTIKRLPRLVTNTQLRADLSRLIATADARTEFARDWRNRQIAHRNLQLAVAEDHPAPLATASRQHVDDALAAISNVLRRVIQHYQDSDLAFDPPGGPGDALDLLCVLRDGVSARNARRQRFARGEPTPEDLHFPPAI